MTLYLDTSVLVAAMTNERKTDRMQAWLASQPAGALSISDWVMTEFLAALSIKVRSGTLRTEHQRAALAEMTHMAIHNYTVLSIERTTFQAAARLADEVGHGLRAGDALHLATTAAAGARLCTLDRRLAEAGNGLGIAADLI